MEQFLYMHVHGPALIFLVTLLLVLMAAGLGLLFGHLRSVPDPGSDLLQSGMLTLLSLLLAFGVSMADVRYEARKTGELEESNAIGKTYLRADLLPGPSGKELKEILATYLKLRIDFYESLIDAGPLTPFGKELGELQQRAWSLASREALKSPAIEKNLLLTSLNETFDNREKQDFAFLNRVPLSIIGMLYLSSLIVSCLAGYRQAQKESRHLMSILSLALLITMTLFVILDLDRPRRGLIRIEPNSLLRLQTEVEHEGDK